MKSLRGGTGLSMFKKMIPAAVAALLAMNVLSGFQKTGEAEKGKELFEQCGVCHNADSEEKKMGPGLKGLYKKAKMTNGKKPSDETVLGVINAGGNGMPAYDSILSDEEKKHLLAYLKTL